MRITIDTNVIVSAIFFGGRPRQLLEELFSKNIEAVASPEILVKYQETFNELRSRYPGKPVHFPLTQIAAFFKLVIPSHNYDVCRDPDDNKFIDCAVEGKCIYIVSGDKDLLSIEQFKNVEIITVSEFFERYQSEKS